MPRPRKSLPSSVPPSPRPIPAPTLGSTPAARTKSRHAPPTSAVPSTRATHAGMRLRVTPSHGRGPDLERHAQDEPSGIHHQEPAIERGRWVQGSSRTRAHAPGGQTQPQAEQPGAGEPARSGAAEKGRPEGQGEPSDHDGGGIVRGHVRGWTLALTPDRARLADQRDPGVPPGAREGTVIRLGTQDGRRQGETQPPRDICKATLISSQETAR